MNYDQNKSKGQGNNPDKMAAEAKSAAKNTSEQAKDQARSQISAKKETAAGELETVAHAVKAAASDLHEQNREGLSGYVSEVANSVGALADGLRNKSVDELVHDVEGIARKNPALFIAGSLAIGLGISRFAKASNRRSESRSVGARDDENRGSYDAYASDYGSQSYDSDRNQQTSSGLAGSLSGGYGATTSAEGYSASSVSEEDYAADDYAAADLGSESDEGSYSGAGYKASDRQDKQNESSTAKTGKNDNSIGGTRYER